MLGGIGGHAGLFSNAIDLATLGQMLLNDGTFAGHEFLKKETIALFSARQFEDSRRGLGFDKPETNTKKSGPTCEEAPFGVRAYRIHRHMRLDGSGKPAYICIPLKSGSSESEKLETG